MLNTMHFYNQKTSDFISHWADPCDSFPLLGEMRVEDLMDIDSLLGDSYPAHQEAVLFDRPPYCLTPPISTLSSFGEDEEYSKSS
jgi:hypothetical protein